MKKPTKKDLKEVKEFAKKYELDATTSAITLLPLFEKEVELPEKINVIKSGLMAFLMMIQEREEKIN